MDDYLVDIESQQRELSAILRYVGLGIGSPLMYSLGLDFYTWCIVGIKHERLISQFRNSGDVDILVGNLRIEENQLRWPPLTNHLVGIEAKCAVNIASDVKEVAPDDLDAAHHSPSKQRHIQKQLVKLLRMGFNKVGFFDFIANPPLDGAGSYPWTAASWFASTSIDALSQKEMHSNSREHPDKIIPRFKEDSPVGHWLISKGAVAGGNESFRGAEITKLIQDAKENPHLQIETTQKHREEMEKNLTSIFQQLPVPRSTPVIIVACLECNGLHYYDNYERGYFCPKKGAFAG
jgi:hypothetical protein